MLLGDDSAPVVVNGGHVDRLKTRRDPVLRGTADDIRDFTGMQQRLRRDAPAVQARPADLVAFDESNSPAEFPGTQRCRVAAGAATEDHDVEGIVAHRSASLSTNSMRLRVVAAVGPLSVNPNGAPLFMPTPAISR